MRVLILAILVVVALPPELAASPFFLTPQRLRRLKRDRERQTPRWMNFEKRVTTVTDAPERGLELALYYAITGDETRGKQAVDWVRAHPGCDSLRQSLLIQSWVGKALSQSALSSTSSPLCLAPPRPPSSIIEWRDKTLSDIAAGRAPDPVGIDRVEKDLQRGSYLKGADLYAAVEFLALVRGATRTDPRELAPRFFTALPTLLLLGLRPAQVEKPDWQTHLGALALVSLDTNSKGAQFLQAWAIEDPQMIREGPGVLYELLWADPYLPGVGYQNLDPWIYSDDDGTLFARADWSPSACWIHLASGVHEAENCPPGWEQKTTHFGHLTLLPAAEKCTPIAANGSETVVVTRLDPRQKLRYEDGKDKQHAEAGPSGLWRAPANFAGKVCSVR